MEYGSGRTPCVVRYSFKHESYIIVETQPQSWNPRLPQSRDSLASMLRNGPKYVDLQLHDPFPFSVLYSGLGGIRNDSLHGIYATFPKSWLFYSFSGNLWLLEGHRAFVAFDSQWLPLLGFGVGIYLLASFVGCVWGCCQLDMGRGLHCLQKGCPGK